MKNYITALCTFLALASITKSSAQQAYVLPSPTGANDLITLYIDVNQTTSGLKTILTNHPEVQDQVYIWTWNPADPANGGNGSWNNSNETMKLTHEGNLLYSLTFIPTQFYGVDGPTFFTKGISCLAKLKDGNAFGDDGVGEAKTEDIHITIIPKLCDELYCTFPQQGKQDDYISITYDNTQETLPALQNLGSDEVFLYIKAVTDVFNGGPEYTSQVSTSSTPELKMKPVPGQPGLFRLTIIPSEFFAALVNPNLEILKLRFVVVKPGYTHSPQSLGALYEEYVFPNCND